MEVQEGSGLSCTVQSLHSEMSHLIGRHSAVQLRPPPYIWLQGRLILENHISCEPKCVPCLPVNISQLCVSLNKGVLSPCSGKAPNNYCVNKFVTQKLKKWNETQTKWLDILWLMQTFDSFNWLSTVSGSDHVGSCRSHSDHAKVALSSTQWGTCTCGILVSWIYSNKINQGVKWSSLRDF